MKGHKYHPFSGHEGSHSRKHGHGEHEHGHHHGFGMGSELGEHGSKLGKKFGKGMDGLRGEGKMANFFKDLSMRGG